MRVLEPLDSNERPMTQIPLGDILDGHTKYPYALLIAQWEVEQILARRLDALGRTVHRECTVTGLRDLDDGIGVILANGETIRAKYVVGADGSKSLVYLRFHKRRTRHL
jgi:2-polyprenyl-6-methoxyphenol hydroxylase-like FAD-dependent oxidoreductase